MKNMGFGNHAVIRVTSNDEILFEENTTSHVGPQPQCDPGYYRMTWRKHPTYMPGILLEMYVDYLYAKHNLSRNNWEDSRKLDELEKFKTSSDDIYFSVTLPYRSKDVYRKEYLIKLWSNYVPAWDDTVNKRCLYIRDQHHYWVDYTGNVETKWKRGFILPIKCYRHSGTVTINAQIRDLRTAYFNMDEVHIWYIMHYPYS